VPNNGDIQIHFGGAELNKNFGKPGGVLGSAKSPEWGRVSFDKEEIWTEQRLLVVALHEVGHALGLQHSNNPASIMSPVETGQTDIDAESIDGLRKLYGWKTQIALADRATSDRPAMAVATSEGLTFSNSTLHMVWKGSRDDQRLFESRLENGVWTPQSHIPDRISSHSPAMTSMPLHDGTISTGLIMAWKGDGDDQGLYFSTNTVNGWVSQQKIPNVGSSHRPALANLGKIFMAWKGVEDDQGIFWSRLTSGEWEPQRKIPSVGTSDSPALVVFQLKLFMFWKGMEGDNRVFFSSLDANDTWAPQRVVTFPVSEAGSTTFRSIGTTHGPSATQHGNRILLAWKGVEERGIYFSLFDGNEFTGQIRVHGVGTTQGPGVCAFRDIATHMAWKGVEGDNVIYWSTLDGG
jgi:hypothetical protein